MVMILSAYCWPFPFTISQTLACIWSLRSIFSGKEGDLLIFAAVHKNAEERRKLTALLLSLYPGCIIYEYAQPVDVLVCMRNHRLDAVFLILSGKSAEDMCVLTQIRKKDPNIPVLICAEDDALLEEAMWNGASNYFVTPLQPEQIRTALVWHEKESVNLQWKLP